MKCPKCGKEYIKGIHGLICTNCRMTKQEIDRRYQKRLLKVLEKFVEEEGSNGIIQHYEKELLKITYYGYTKEFRLCRQFISFDTVEHLIEDMEAE